MWQRDYETSSSSIQGQFFCYGNRHHTAVWTRSRSIGSNPPGLLHTKCFSFADTGKANMFTPSGMKLPHGSTLQTILHLWKLTRMLHAGFSLKTQCKTKGSFKTLLKTVLNEPDTKGPQDQIGDYWQRLVVSALSTMHYPLNDPNLQHVFFCPEISHRSVDHYRNEQTS